jgi:hypothetical protein
VLNADPAHVQPYLPAIQADPYRLQPRFRPSSLITMSLPPNVLGDYHLQGGSSAVGVGATQAPAPSGDTVKRPLTDIDGDFRPATGPDAGADQLTPALNAQPVALVTGGGGGGRALPTGLPSVKGPGAPKPRPGTGVLAPVVPTSGSGQAAAATTHGAAAVAVSPPEGSVANVVAVDGPNQAGNTAVIQLFGPRPKINGVPQVQPTTNVPAAMPGGIAGGGHFKVGHHRQGGSLSWLFALLASMAVLGIGWWNGRRRRPEPPPEIPAGPPAPPDPPVTESIQPDRPLVLAGKGDWS